MANHWRSENDLPDPMSFTAGFWAGAIVCFIGYTLILITGLFVIGAIG